MIRTTHTARALAAFTLAAAAFAGPALAAAGAEGLVTLPSPHDTHTTMDRLAAAAEARGLTVFARIDHAAGAAKVGATLRPTELIIFGNPKAGTPLMQCAQTAGLDLPLKALAWQDADGRTWLGYTHPAVLGARHGAADCPVLPRMAQALEGLAAAAVAR